MRNVVLGLILAFGLSVVVVTVLDDYWLNERERRTLEQKLHDFFHSLQASDSMRIIQGPIGTLSWLIEKRVGRPLWSWEAFKWSTATGLILFFFTVAVRNHEPIPPDGRRNTPAENFDVVVEMLNKVPAVIEDMKIPVSTPTPSPSPTWTPEPLFKRPTSDAKAKPRASPSPTPATRPLTPDEKATALKIAHEIGGFYSPGNRDLYTTFFYPMIFCGAAFLFFVSGIFARQTLLDMSTANSLTSIFCLGIGNFAALLFFAVVGFLFFCVAAIPLSWSLLWALYQCGTQVSWLLASVLVVPGAALALFLGPDWLRLLAGLMIVPELVAIVISIGAICLYPFRKRLHWLIVKCMSKGLDSKKGILAFYVFIVWTFLVAAVWIAAFFGADLPTL